MRNSTVATRINYKMIQQYRLPLHEYVFFQKRVMFVITENDRNFKRAASVFIACQNFYVFMIFLLTITYQFGILLYFHIFI